MNKPFVLAVANRKGGTGKTTTVVNLAAEFAMRGARTLVIDLDTQGHAGLGLGVASRKGAPAAHHIFRFADWPLAEAVVASAYERLAVIPADQDFDCLGVEADTRRLSAQLQGEAFRDYDVILLDTPPSLDIILISAMSAAQGVLVPLTPHFLSAEGVRQLSRLFFRVASTLNPSLKLLGLLPVMVDRRVKLHNEVIAEMQREFGAHRLMRGVRPDIKLAEAFSMMKPISVYAPKSRGAMDYRLLAGDLSVLWGGAA